MPAPRARPLVPVALLLLAAAGCALVSHQPQTPARQVSFQDLNDPAPPEDRYFLLVFGAQTTPKVPRFTHTWVTFVRASAPVPGQSPAVEHHSISWMPATLFIRTLWPCAEPGVNLTLHDSINMALGYHERVSMWGPFEIPPGLYRKLMIQKGFLESGAVAYQCTDTYGEAGLTGDASNCAHAISDADTLFTRVAYPLSLFGDSASLNILWQLVIRGAVPDPTTTHDWLIPCLGLDAYPICRREYKAPLFCGPLRFGHVKAEARAAGVPVPSVINPGRQIGP